MSLCRGKRRSEKRVGDAAAPAGAKSAGGAKPAKKGFVSKVLRPVKSQKSKRTVFPEAFKFKIAVLGIDDSGKTTFISRVTRAPAEQTQTTWGFTSCNVDGPNGEVMTLYDLGGHSRIRGIWVNYIAEVHAVVYMVDAANRTRLPEARQALHDIYGDQRLFGKPLIMCADRPASIAPAGVLDAPNALPPADVYKELGVDGLKLLFPDLSKSQQDLARAAAHPPETASKQPREEVLRSMVAVVGCKSLLHIEKHATHVPDPSVDKG
ncbi:MAG: ADP-ribosylation factor family-domain-containing protein [Olpidium bornovanus]|uniref:ADP-ribosylation factor family-domain-containing protein n=1 Tax=Olpidium bornovanus TaxID=278681 RepID=A0A8H7ZPV3_9FUNG|nr:MAG: ADP-ribosylation factor family-domain-containing protein [Olpidium bornovanus]